MKRSQSRRRVALLLCAVLLVGLSGIALGEAQTYKFSSGYVYNGMVAQAKPNGFGMWTKEGANTHVGEIKDGQGYGMVAVLYPTDDQNGRFLSMGKAVGQSNWEWHYIFYKSGMLAYSEYDENGTLTEWIVRDTAGNHTRYDVVDGEPVNPTLLNEEDVSQPLLSYGKPEAHTNVYDNRTSYFIYYPDAKRYGPQISLYNDGSLAMYTGINDMLYYYNAANDFYTFGSAYLNDAGSEWLWKNDKTNVYTDDLINQ